MSKIYTQGIDTSKWQGSKVDYYLAKQAGIDFVFLRIGYNKTKDTCFEADYANAVKAGLKVGVYFYTLATDSAMAVADATRVLGWLNNRHLDFPVAYDMEDAKQKKLSKDLNSYLYNDFRDKIESTGTYDCMLYTGESFYNTYFNKSLIKDDVWIAKYNSVEPNIGRLVQIWQYTSAYQTSTYYKGKLDKNYMLTEKMTYSSIVVERISNNPYAEPTKTLKLTLPRMTGSDVKWLQWELYEAGIMAPNDIDGIFGNKTKECVLQYQKEHGLLQDAKVGSATRYALKND